MINACQFRQTRVITAYLLRTIPWFVLDIERFERQTLYESTQICRRSDKHSCHHHDESFRSVFSQGLYVYLTRESARWPAGRDRRACRGRVASDVHTSCVHHSTHSMMSSEPTSRNMFSLTFQRLLMRRRLSRLSMRRRLVRASAVVAHDSG